MENGSSEGYFPPAGQWRLYDDLAWLWPVISPPEEHVRENEEFARMLRECSPEPVRTLLHLGCGGGHDDFTLKKHFKITGVDISSAMLGMAERLNPELKYHAGDMRTVRLGETFDAVIIGDSIGYMVTREDLLAVFQTAFVHLKPGGVLLTLVEETMESFQQNKTSCSTHVQDVVEVTFIENYYDANPDDSAYEAIMIFLIRRQGRLTVEIDRHRLGLFSLDTWWELLEVAGFSVEQRELRARDVEERVYPVLLGTKPS
jgi:SAM-dependent methyltransferase